MQRLSIQKGHAFMLLYSVTRKQTLEELKPIYNQIREIKADQQGDTPILLMGCKLDEAACREVTETLGKQLANLWSCAWIETSAKNNVNIREAFQELLKLDKKRNFNFNVDSDGHPTDENGSSSVAASPSLRGVKRIATTHSSSSTTTNSGSSPNMTESTTTGAIISQATPPSSRHNKTSRTSISSNSNSKKNSRSLLDSNDLAANGKRPIPTDSSSNRNLPRKCHIM